MFQEGSFPFKDLRKGQKPPSLVTRVAALSNDKRANSIAQENGLNISLVAWEDTARTKDSCFGPICRAVAQS